jgi:hypothetical protein
VIQINHDAPRIPAPSDDAGRDDELFDWLSLGMPVTLAAPDTPAPDTLEAMISQSDIVYDIALGKAVIQLLPGPMWLV